MRLLTAALTMAALSTNAAAFSLFDGDDVDNAMKQARAERELDLLASPELCSVLSPEACALLSNTPNIELQYPDLQPEDFKILKELVYLTPAKVSEGEEEVFGDARESALRASAMTLGVQVGVAMESARYNRLWVNYAEVYDRMIDFEPFLIEYGAGRNIIPPVVRVMNNSQRIDAGGRVFRVADTVYRIVKQPVFTIAPPTWREYLFFDIEKPVMPVSGLMPKTAHEISYWRAQLIKGYYQGIEVTRHRVSAKYRALAQDYIGMANYHLLREYNMISEPIVELAHNPVLSTHGGESMSIDDTVAVISVKPMMNAISSSWKAYPQLKKMSDIQRQILESNTRFMGIGR